MNRFAGLARILVLAVLLVALVAAVILWLSLPRLVAVSPAEGAADVPAAAPLTLQFSRPMQPASVEARLQIEPSLPGKFSWNENTLTFTPDRPWPAGEAIQVQLKSGAAAQGMLALPLQGQHAWQFSVRQPRLVFLFPATGPANLYLRDPLAGANQYLTDLRTGVLDYSLAPGDRIVYSARNAQAGSDLFVLDLSRPEPQDGAAPTADAPPAPPAAQPLLACAPATCRLASISPDGAFLAYERAELPAAGQIAQAHVWYAPLDRLQAAVQAGDPAHTTTLPAWSPQGWLTYYDQDAQAFVVVKPGGAEQARFPNDTGQPGSWEPGGQGLIIPEIGFVDANVSSALQNLERVANSHLVLHRVPGAGERDLSQEEILEDAVPAVSPDGIRLAFARKYLDTRRWTPGRQIWLMELPGGAARALTEDAEYNHFDFAWTPDSRRLAYVRFNQSLMTDPPEIWVLDVQTGEKKLLIAGGYSPQWIP